MIVICVATDRMRRACRFPDNPRGALYRRSDAFNVNRSNAFSDSALDGQIYVTLSDKSPQPMLA